MALHKLWQTSSSSVWCGFLCVFVCFFLLRALGAQLLSSILWALLFPFILSWTCARRMTWFSFRLSGKHESYLISPWKQYCRGQFPHWCIETNSASAFKSIYNKVYLVFSLTISSWVSALSLWASCNGSSHWPDGPSSSPLLRDCSCPMKRMMEYFEVQKIVSDLTWHKIYVYFF